MHLCTREAVAEFRPYFGWLISNLAEFGFSKTFAEDLQI